MYIVEWKSCTGVRLKLCCKSLDDAFENAMWLHKHHSYVEIINAATGEPVEL